ncbi:FecR family protein [Roseomonas sp. 18066]|uniref:FecR family protein n=1 Tax=Roseomonas sp. 18066 TaxID=2681412 RepID=UPI001356CCF4|nr:FecR family protein [Roseomonas sp. 18066]
MLRRGALLLPLLALATPAEARRARAGVISALRGEAAALFSGSPPRALSPAAELLVDDLVSTGPASRLVALLEGGVEIRLGESASLRVDALTLQGPQRGAALRVFGGPVLVDKDPAQPASVTLELPWARIGVRGTRFFAGPLDGRHAVFVERGQVAVEAAGVTVALGAGEGVDMASIGAPPGPVVRWGAPRIARALALVE